jgi:IS30 family transposase
LSTSSSKFAIEERRRQVASLLAKCKTETEIATILGVDQSTISDDVKALRLMSQRFVYDLAKSDLSVCYKECLDGIQEEKKKRRNELIVT